MTTTDDITTRTDLTPDEEAAAGVVGLTGLRAAQRGDATFAPEAVRRAIVAPTALISAGEVILRAGYNHAPRLCAAVVEIDGRRIGVCRWSDAYGRPSSVRVLPLASGDRPTPEAYYAERYASAMLRGEGHAARSEIVGWTDRPQRWSGHEGDALYTARRRAVELAWEEAGWPLAAPMAYVRGAYKGGVVRPSAQVPARVSQHAIDRAVERSGQSFGWRADDVELFTVRSVGYDRITATVAPSLVGILTADRVRTGRWTLVTVRHASTPDA